MTPDELRKILDKHAKWLRGEDGGQRADLSRADLSRADLSRADLSRAVLSRAVLSGTDLSRAVLSGTDLSRAVLSRADLRGTDLSCAVLSGAVLSRADLNGAVLSGADLSRADLRGTDLRGTCLSNDLRDDLRKFVKQCPVVNRHGGRIVYRSKSSRHIGNTHYLPGHTYVAPVLSFDCATDCHPGIYAASPEWIRKEYDNIPLVRCYVRDGDWVITAKGAIRCKRIRILSYVKDEPQPDPQKASK